MKGWTGVCEKKSLEYFALDEHYFVPDSLKIVGILLLMDRVKLVIPLHRVLP